MLLKDEQRDSSSDSSSLSVKKGGYTLKKAPLSSKNFKAKFLTKEERTDFHTDEQKQIKQEEKNREKELHDLKKEQLNRNKDKINSKGLRNGDDSDSSKEDKAHRRDKNSVGDNNAFNGSDNLDKKQSSYVTSNTRSKIPVKVTQELESIKMQYQGLTKEKKKQLKPSEKFKNIFNFDWHASEDTSWDANPLYNTRHESMVQFGKGKMGGIDIEEQLENSGKYEKLVKKFVDVEAKSEKDREYLKREKENTRVRDDRDSDYSRHKEKRDKRDKKYKERDSKKDKRGKDKRKKDKHHRRERSISHSSSYSRSKSHSRRSRSRSRSVSQKRKERELQSSLRYTKYNSLGDSQHWSKKKIKDMTERDWRIFREDHEISITGGKCNFPIRTWDENGFDSNLRKNIADAGYEKPTSIQMQAIPVGIERRDQIAQAPTGSGKTSAFVIPLIEFQLTQPRIDHITSNEGPHAIILAPTRELAIQIDTEFNALAKDTKLKSVIVVGGRSAEEQQIYLRNGSDVIIATPGRQKDCQESRFTILTQCKYVVIDEADIMINMDLEEAQNFILDSIPKDNLKSFNEEENDLQIRSLNNTYDDNEKIDYRTTLMFSATMPNQLEQIARTYLRCPAWISIGEPRGGKKDITHIVECMDEGNKRQALQKRLRIIHDDHRKSKSSRECQILIFMNHKKDVESLYKLLNNERHSVTYYHGGLTQVNRESTILNYKAGKYEILVATDLAGRGLDIKGVKYVISFDCPKSLEQYIHRAGRTGRAGKKGTAITFLTFENDFIFYDLVNFQKQNGADIPFDLENHPSSQCKTNLGTNMALDFVNNTPGNHVCQSNMMQKVQSFF